jgi:hypothetical protein
LIRVICVLKANNNTDSRTVSLRPSANQFLISNPQTTISDQGSIHAKKRMKAERNKPANTLRGTLLLRMANSRTLAKHRVHHPEGSLPSSLANRYFDCQKTKGAGFKLPREAARSFNSREFAFEIWERESAPAD